jgi:hypothetical protein
VPTPPLESRFLHHQGSVQVLISVVSSPLDRFQLLWRVHDYALQTAAPGLDLAADETVTLHLIESASVVLRIYRRNLEAEARCITAAHRAKPDRLQHLVELSHRYPEATDRLYSLRPVLEGAAIARGLDVERAAVVADEAIFGYLRAIEGQVKCATGPIDEPFLILALLLGRALKDEFRRQNRLGRIEQPSSGIEKTSLPNATEPDRSEAPDLTDTVVPRLPGFFQAWVGNTGGQGPEYIRDLRRCCLEDLMLVDLRAEFGRLHAFLFVRGHDEKYPSSRVDLQGRLRWFADRTPGARYQATFRVRERLARAWHAAWNECGFDHWSFCGFRLTQLTRGSE